MIGFLDTKQVLGTSDGEGYKEESFRKAHPCPDLKGNFPNSMAKCGLNDKYCLLETDGFCPTYEDWLFEVKQEELDKT